MSNMNPRKGKPEARNESRQNIDDDDTRRPPVQGNNVGLGRGRGGITPQNDRSQIQIAAGSGAEDNTKIETTEKPKDATKPPSVADDNRIQKSSKPEKLIEDNVLRLDARVPTDLANCRYEEFGCPYMGVAFTKEFRDHYSACQSRPIKCFVPWCRYEGPAELFRVHLISSHEVPIEPFTLNQESAVTISFDLSDFLIAEGIMVPFLFEDFSKPDFIFPFVVWTNKGVTHFWIYQITIGAATKEIFQGKVTIQPCTLGLHTPPPDTLPLVVGNAIHDVSVPFAEVIMSGRCIKICSDTFVSTYINNYEEENLEHYFSFVQVVIRLISKSSRCAVIPQNVKKECESKEKKKLEECKRLKEEQEMRLQEEAKKKSEEKKRLEEDKKQKEVEERKRLEIEESNRQKGLHLATSLEYLPYSIVNMSLRLKRLREKKQL